MEFLLFFVVAIIILELITMDKFLSIVLASPLDSYAFRDINDTSNYSERIGNIANVSSSGSQQRENDTALAISPVLSQRIMTNSSSSSLLLPVSNNNTCITYNSINRTVNICGGSADLSTIDQVINSSDVLNNTSDKNWILNTNISVENGATLFINSTDTNWLRINSTAGRTYSI